MSESDSRGVGGRSSSTVAVVVLWILVLLPLLWGIYQTLTGVAALFS